MAPTVTSACAAPTSGKKVTVSWSAVTHATSYAIYQSTTTWTSAALATGSYWYEVVTDIATNWAGAKSAATTQRTISSSACS